MNLGALHANRPLSLKYYVREGMRGSFSVKTISTERRERVIRKTGALVRPHTF